MRKKITYEQLKKLVESKDFILIDKTCDKAISKISVYDNEGYYYITSYNQLQQNRIPERFHKYNKFTIKNIENYLKINNIDLQLLNNTYINSFTKMTFKDSNNYYYYSTLQNIIANVKPNAFDKSNIYTIKNINLWLKYNNVQLILLDNNFKSALTKMIFKDYDGYYYFTNWNVIQQKHFPERFHKSNPYTIQNIKLWCKLNNKPFELVSDKYIDSDKNKLKWKCLKENCGEEFDTMWYAILNGVGCGVCEGRQVTLLNCLATTHPEIAKEWHPINNGDLTPYDVTIGSNKSFWWQCSKNPKHEWYIEVNARNYNGCPYCCHNPKPSEDYNLLVINPELCKEWDYERNDENPENYTPKSRQYIYWKCKECGHKWGANISDRSNGNGCPECNKSKGEKKISEILVCNNWIKISQKEFNKLIDKDKYNKNYFIPQMKYNGLIGLGGCFLLYDYYLPKLNLIIEYDGEFHFRIIKYKSESIEQAKERYNKQQIHDRMKNKYAINNNLSLLRIPYWEFDNIEEILNRELNMEEISFEN